MEIYKCCEAFPNQQNHQIDKFSMTLGLILSMENKSQAIRHRMFGPSE
jgi:hypothetical protein